MTPAELLKPRYKVIADYPRSVFFVGEILRFDGIETAGVGYYGNGEGFVRAVNQPNKYPHLFKPLQWWEEREENELPNYIRLNEVCVVKVAKHHCQRFDEFQAHDTKYNYPYGICKPATEQEYLNQSLKP